MPCHKCVVQRRSQDFSQPETLCTFWLVKFSITQEGPHTFKPFLYGPIWNLCTIITKEFQSGNDQFNTVNPHIWELPIGTLEYRGHNRMLHQN